MKNRNIFFWSNNKISYYLLDTEANSTAPESEENEWKGRGGERSGTVKTPTSSTMRTANTGKVKFEPPSVPVIFVLGNNLFLWLLIKINGMKVVRR